MQTKTQIRVAVIICLILVTGYIVSICFKGMNMADDSAYIGGILGLLVWSFVVTIVLKVVFKKKENKETKENKGEFKI